MNTGYADPYAVSGASSEVRADFIKRTYLHLAGAIVAFAVLEGLLLQTNFGQKLGITMMQNWLIVIGAFMLVSWVADRWAQSGASVGKQYLGLGLFVAAEAVIFLPLMMMAQRAAGADVISKAALVTGILVAGLTVVVFVSGKDFSFMGTFLKVGGFVALGTIVVAVLFKFELGILFSGAMVLFACGSILYTTSNIVHHYRPGQHVAASLALFSGVALLFYYILMIFMRRD